ncbi:exopolysaccharide biosynthesis polyprenyl glycosylphosphotransferase [uncultured Holdemanella sp.]|uniref:exopolysaccharide biosynthesis polyprenyl glycosylphosphotransferase n=1 Tax=uncultured Holdemanella sp. TaxID=1763549 RepID=UPI00258F232C|nr:exopolysaccharide biosynthesis polyprenyl glycosylphosphotransferase [uncultured Holdemanella sp.]
MSKIGYLKITIEFIFYWILINFLQEINLLRFYGEYTIKLCALYFLMQLLIGRYQGKVLLMYDEIRLLILSHLGFFFGSFLIFPFDSWTIRKIYGFLLLSLALFLLAGFNSRYSHKVFRKNFKHNTLIVGIGHTAARLAFVCRGNSYSLLDVQGFVNCKSFGINQEQIVDKDLTIQLEDVDLFIESHNIDTVLIAIPEIKKIDLDSLFRMFKEKVSVIKYLPQVNGLVTFDTKVEDFDGILMISNSRGVSKIGSYVLKRIMDICAGLCGIFLLIPLTIFVYIKTRKSGDKGPIFYVQKRIGKDGKEFKIYKFRTMVEGADKILEDLILKDPLIRDEYKKSKKLVDDPRITEIGKFLREKSLDEFPQLINVFLGQMSLIGPRPYLPREKKDMGDYYDDIICCKPGLTGMWQTHGRSDVDFEHRLVLDEYYYRNWSFWLDVTILFKTVKQVLYGYGAF